MTIQYRFQAEIGTMNKKEVGWRSPPSRSFLFFIGRSIKLTYVNIRYSALEPRKYVE
jgi:hypothetical protein